MKLLRFGDPGVEKPGILDSDGRIRDLSGVIHDFSTDNIRAESLASLKKVDLGSLPLAPSDVRIGPCLPKIRHFIAVGLNYIDHAHETNSPIPDVPILFSKAPTSLSGPNDPIQLPATSRKTDWEVELALVINRHTRGVSSQDAPGHIAGFCICNDVSEREWQLERPGGQWFVGKSAPTFGPLGPWLVTPDEIENLNNLNMYLDVNGERMQTGSTGTMIFDVPSLISYISHHMDLEAGDVITTGTPPGVGMGKSPQRFLRGGDKVELGISGLGMQTQTVVQG